MTCPKDAEIEKILIVRNGRWSAEYEEPEDEKCVYCTEKEDK